jgi:hypothetical protein
VKLGVVGSNPTGQANSTVVKIRGFKMCNRDSEVLRIIQCSSVGLSAREIYYRTGSGFQYVYQVEDSLRRLKDCGYIYSRYGYNYAYDNCCIPAHCCTPRTVYVERTVYVPVVAVQIPTPVAFSKKSYVQYLIECEQQYMIPKSAEEYLLG